MKPIFKCEICGFTDSDPQKVCNCESLHFKAENSKIVKTSSYSSRFPVPKRIFVEFNDGSQAEYLFERVTQTGGASQ